MKLEITHKSTYAYDTPVDYALQQVRLRPTDNALQTVLKWDVKIEGGKEELSFQDQFCNETLLASITPGEDKIIITATGSVETHGKNGVLGPTTERAPRWVFQQTTSRTLPGKGIKALAKKVKNDNALDDLHDLSRRILKAAPYAKAQTFFDTTAEEALAGGAGVCQDHAQIFVAAARHAGIPARYVSGYLMMDDRIDQEASHAWAEAYIDRLGWVGFDISNGISPDERYVRIAIGMDSRDAAPVSGIRLGASAEQMIVSLQVQQ